MDNASLLIIKEFSNKMELTYNKHYNKKGEPIKKGDSYKTFNFNYLINKFNEEYSEVESLINELCKEENNVHEITLQEIKSNIRALQKELIDLSLICMLLDYRLNNICNTKEMR